MAEEGNDAQNFNELCDVMLEHSQRFEKFDPFYFDVKDDSLKVSKGKVTGISSIYRHGDICITTDQEENMHGSLGIGLKNIKYEGKHQVKCGGVWLKGEAKIRLSEIKVKIEFGVGNGSISIDSLRIIEFGKCKVEDLKGFTPVFNKLVKYVLNVTIEVLKASVIERIEKELVKHGNETINKLKIPLAKL